MNVNQPNDARLNRIQSICRYLKIMLLLYLGCLVLLMPSFFMFAHQTAERYWTLFGHTYATLAEAPWLAKLLAVMCVAVLLAIWSTGYQLLGLYERGVVFSEQNVRLLRRIGLLALGYGLVALFGGTLLEGAQVLVGSGGLSWGLLLFQSLSLFISPWVIGGVCVLALSFIMDEGRKIQEEQELTV